MEILELTYTQKTVSSMQRKPKKKKAKFKVMRLFFQFKQHPKIKGKMYVAPPNESVTGALNENAGHVRNKLSKVSANNCNWS